MPTISLTILYGIFDPYTLNSKFREPQFYVTLDQQFLSFRLAWNSKTEARGILFKDMSRPARH